MGGEVTRESGTVKSRAIASTQVIADEPTGFLFVNETPDAPTYKVGNRHDIRSHVRKKAAAEFWIRHKNAKRRDANQPKYVPLASQAVKLAGSDQVGNGRNCPRCKVFAGGEGLLQHTSGRTKLVEIIDHASQTSAVEAQKAIERPGGNGTSCEACGQPISKLQDKHSSNDDSSSPSRLKGRKLVKPNLVGLLGAGRSDPFSTLPMLEPDAFSKELMDHGTFNVSSLVAPLSQEETRLKFSQQSRTWFLVLKSKTPHADKSTQCQKPGLLPAFKAHFFSTPSSTQVPTISTTCELKTSILTHQNPSSTNSSSSNL